MQESARNALNKGLHKLDKREGYRGPLRNLTNEEIDEYKKKSSSELSANPPKEGSIVEGVVEEINNKDKYVIVTVGQDICMLPYSNMEWAKKLYPETPLQEIKYKKSSDVLKPGDVIKCKIIDPGEPPFNWLLSLEQEPVVQGALFALETKTGKVRAMLGGRDFSKSQFNRAIQSRRQPGSAFKPIIYATALDFGMTPATVILDTAYISSLNPDEEVWRPRNYKEKFYGPTLLRESLIHSRNVINVKILKKIKVKNVIDYARRMGIESDLSPDLSLALGSSGLSLKEITSAYSVFANNGMLVKPFFIDRIEDRHGLIIEENLPSLKEVIAEDTAYVITDLLKAVIKEGTGKGARTLNRPAAGKTGTTNDFINAWFIGYTPELLTGVWVGYDDRRSMGKGEQGASAALPIWLDFMKEVLEGQPIQDFIAPESVVFVKIDAEKGLLASPYSKKTIFQSFKKGTEPTEYTEKPETPKSGQFPQFDMAFPE
jgi:penicillin-binding protein 1A